MFSFAWAWIFLLLPLPWLLRVSLPAAKSQTRYLQVPFAHALAELAQAHPTPWLQRTRNYVVPILVWLCLLVASARPQIITQPEQFPSTGRDFLLMLDVSTSMQLEDSQLKGKSVSRLELVQQVFSELVQQRQGDRFGLILFGSQAYVQAPLTLDLHSIIYWLNDAKPGIAGRNTAIGDAIGLAIKRLQQQPAQQRIAILITDGANNSGVMHPLAAAELAAQLGIRIYTVGVGDPATEDATDTLDFDEQTLQQIAEMTRAFYTHANDDQAFAAFVQALDQHHPHQLPEQWQATIQELFPYPLAAAFIFSLMLCAQRLRFNQGAKHV